MRSKPSLLPRTPPIDRNKELLKQARMEPFKSIDGAELSAYIWSPEGSGEGAPPRATAAFFFSSGWDQGQVSQFAPHCVYFASRGMVTVAFEYRVQSQHGTGPLETMVDARSAMRWLRLNAADLGVNPARIVGVGGSGGAHGIASAAMVDFVDDPEEAALDVSPAPNALVLFNPILDTSKKGFGLDRFPDAASAKKANLVKAVRKGLPPSLIMHGTEDRVVPFAGSYDFARRASRKKNQCRLIEFEGQGHGFFNFNLSFERYEATLTAMDEFFVELGYLEPDPNSGLGDPDLD